MWDLEIKLAHAAIPPSAGLAPPANPDRRTIPIKKRIPHVCPLPILLAFLLAFAS
jgi:hypothetical protein